MRTFEIVLSVALGILGVASAVMGFLAEAKLAPGDIDESRSQCVYRANPAFLLALRALFLLMVVQITASAASGCCGCCRRPRTGAFETKRVVGIVASVLSWIVALAGASYLQGAASPNVAAGDGCYYLKRGVFTRAAVLSLVATAPGITSYIMLTSTPAQTPAPAAAPMTAVTGTEPKLGGPGLRANALSAPHERFWSTTGPVGEHAGAGVDDTIPMLTVEMVPSSPGIHS